MSAGQHDKNRQTMTIPYSVKTGCKINLGHVDEAYVLIVHGAIVNLTILQVACYGPLRSAGIIARLLSGRCVASHWHVKVVQQVKQVQHRVPSIGLLSGSVQQVGGTYKA